MKFTLFKNPWLVLALALITGLSFFAAFLHHHEDHHEHVDCPACRLVQIFSLVALFTALLFLVTPVEIRNFFVPPQLAFISLLLGPTLKDRAPPTPSF